MSQKTADDLSACIVFVLFLWVVWKVWVWPLLVERRQPVRRDAPTGDDPWTRPRGKLAS